MFSRQGGSTRDRRGNSSSGELNHWTRAPVRSVRMPWRFDVESCGNFRDFLPAIWSAFSIARRCGFSPVARWRCTQGLYFPFLTVLSSERRRFIFLRCPGKGFSPQQLHQQWGKVLFHPDLDIRCWEFRTAAKAGELTTLNRKVEEIQSNIVLDYLGWPQYMSENRKIPIEEIPSAFKSLPPTSLALYPDCKSLFPLHLSEPLLSYPAYIVYSTGFSTTFIVSGPRRCTWSTGYKAMVKSSIADSVTQSVLFAKSIPRTKNETQSPKQLPE